MERENANVLTIDVDIKLEHWLTAFWRPGQKGFTVSYISSFLIVLWSLGCCGDIFGESVRLHREKGRKQSFRAPQLLLVVRIRNP